MTSFVEGRTGRRSVAHAQRSGRWLADPGFGIYVHIPFCTHRCHYCDFNTYEGQQELHDGYVDALVSEISSWPGSWPPATSVFFGGGTPTLLEPGAVRLILDSLSARFGLAIDCEVTIEANPETVDELAFESLLDGGFNRFSIGVQSLVPSVLAGLGRTHSAKRALDAYRAARRAGAEDINIDLIYGSPWETADDWVFTLERIVEAAPDHVSAYALTVEEGTPLATLVATERVADVDPDIQADRHGVAESLLRSAGYERYEVSNWCRPGRAARHNLLYWSSGDYLAFGAGAHGHRAGRRWWNVRLPRDYIRAVADGRPTEQGSELLEPERRSAEALVLGLRLVDGVGIEPFESRFGTGVLGDTALKALEQSGAVIRAGGRLKLREDMTLLSNDVLSRLI